MKEFDRTCIYVDTQFQAEDSFTVGNLLEIFQYSSTRWRSPPHKGGLRGTLMLDRNLQQMFADINVNATIWLCNKVMSDNVRRAFFKNLESMLCLLLFSYFNKYRLSNSMNSSSAIINFCGSQPLMTYCRCALFRKSDFLYILSVCSPFFLLQNFIHQSFRAIWALCVQNPSLLYGAWIF